MLAAANLRAFTISAFSLLLIGCPLGDQTIFYQVKGTTFHALDVAVYRVDVIDIVVSWHPESAAGTLKHHTTYQTKAIWKVRAVRSVQLAGLSFEMFKTPAGFKSELNKSESLARKGVFSLEIYCHADNQRKISVYHEFSPQDLDVRTPQA